MRAKGLGPLSPWERVGVRATGQISPPPPPPPVGRLEFDLFYYRFYDFIVIIR